jgi:hypothetical protein
MTLSIVVSEGRSAAAGSESVTLSTEDKSVLDNILTAIQGTVADGDSASGDPALVGANGYTAISAEALVDDGDRVALSGGTDRVLVVRPHCAIGDIVSGVAAITDGSSTQVIAAQASGIKTYITTVIIANSSATAVTVDIRDGAAGTVKATFPVPANTSGVVCNLPVPLPFSAATAVCADPSAAASTVTVSIVGFKSKL